MTGPGTSYRVRFTASAVNAWTTITFGVSTAFYDDGPRADQVEAWLLDLLGRRMASSGRAQQPAGE